MTQTVDAPVVVGGGICGLTLAASLARQGRSCTVLERASVLAEMGAGVQLTPRSVQLLRDAGVMSAELEHAGRVTARQIRDWDGRVISTTRLGACESRYGAPYLTMHRADLQRALRSALPDGILRLSTPVTAVQQTAQSVRVNLADGSQVRAPAVIGADGIRSVVRQGLVADRPIPSGYTAFRALLPTAELDDEAREPVVRIWVGPGQHTVTYPVRRGQLLNVVAVLPARGGGEDWSAPARVADLLEPHLGWDPLLTGVLARVETATAWALHDRSVLSQLAYGRVALAGDAAHPMLPFAAQGVNQAIEDASTLVRLLTDDGPASLTERLVTYDRLRSGPAGRAQTTAREMITSLHLRNAADRQLRDAHMVAGSSLAHQDSTLAPWGWRPQGRSRRS